MTSAKIPTGYALKKRLLKLEYQTKIVGLDDKTVGAQAQPNEGDYRVIVLRSSKLTGVDTNNLTNVNSSAKVITKRIKKTVFNTIEGIKGAKSAMKGSSELRLGSKLPVTYVYSVNPPAKSLKEQYEHLALLAPYIPIKTIVGKANDNSASGFIGCLIASPSVKESHKATKGTGGSNLVFYYPSQLKTWLGNLVTSGNAESGLVELLQSLDLTILNLLTQLNNSLDTICVLSKMAEQKEKEQNSK